MKEPVYAEFNERVVLEMPFSEVCVHMRIAGTVMMAELLPTEYSATAQIYTLEGNTFSFPVTYSEAGFYKDQNGYYYYPHYYYPPRR